MSAPTTIRRLLRPATLAVLASLTLVVACTPSRASAPQTDPASQSPTRNPASAPSAVATDSPADTSSPAPQTPATKPNKAEVLEGVRQLVRSSTGPNSKNHDSGSTGRSDKKSDQNVERYYNCVVDELYDTLTPGQLRQLADASLPSDATPELRSAVDLCVQKMGAKR